MELVSEAEIAAGASLFVIQDEGVLSVDLTVVDVTRLLKVDGYLTKNGLTTVSRRCHCTGLGHLLLICVTAGWEVGVIRRISGPIGQRLNHFLIVRVVDGWILRLQAASGRATNLVLNAIHPNWFAN